MEIGSIVEFLENKSILITGATGFLAKIFVEKILRVQPNVKKLFLLLRAPDAETASQRFRDEIIGKDLFRVIKEKCGPNNFDSFISKKIVLVPGDLSLGDDLGVKDSNLIQEMFSELDAVVNLAASTSFDERYDVALGLNTMGAKHVLCFSKKCDKLKVFIQVSTAYVCGEKPGLILETSYRMGESLNGVTGLDIEEETKLIQAKLNQLQTQGANDSSIKEAMKDLGLERAKRYGWPNTYVFTKAMGEMIVQELKEDLSVAIVRPTIVTATFKEPFPGWVEGIRTYDALTVGYGKGKVTFFLGAIDGVVDVVPADMVVNAIIMSMVVHAKNKNIPNNGIYQVGSSVRNPVRNREFQEFAYRYFTNKPWIDKNGKLVKVRKIKLLDSMASFHRYITIRYLTLLKGLQLANVAFCNAFNTMYSDLNRKITLVMRLAELYRPYLFFAAVFDDTNTEMLRVAVRENCVETDTFYFDPVAIDWAEYVINTHISGAVKYLFK